VKMGAGAGASPHASLPILNLGHHAHPSGGVDRHSVRVFSRCGVPIDELRPPLDQGRKRCCLGRNVLFLPDLT
jgi:hypothetical protein